MTEVLKPSRSGRLAGAGIRSGASDGGPAHPAAAAAGSVAKTAAPRSSASQRPRTASTVPDSVLNDAALNADIALLPANYSFEVHKTVHRVRTANARLVALQMPEGLLIYASVLADILRAHCHGAQTVVMGDVTYGACCVDDLSAAALGADLLVHYGHSCLVPVQRCAVPMLYVFVHIAFDTTHLLRCLRDEFPLSDKPRLALLSTIQFVPDLHAVRDEVETHFGKENVVIPQAHPLSPGELLGCTSPDFTESANALVYVADGRFHLESAMIANPTLPAYRYDPYSKSFTSESYGHDIMLAQRRAAVEAASDAKQFGVILGTLGRQGSVVLLNRVQEALAAADRSAIVVLLSELSPAKVQRMEECGVVQAWIQIACPRLSIDWGGGYGRQPLLTPYEMFVALGAIEWRRQYPMDFYAKKGGKWSNYYKPPVHERATSR
jgi:2-(3-amino-3-carboxypropyl)histidine synthase